MHDFFWRGRLLEPLKNGFGDIITLFGAVWGLGAIWGEGVDHHYIPLVDYKNKYIISFNSISKTQNVFKTIF